MKATVSLTVLLLCVGFAGGGEIITDGNMDALTVGNNPDCTAFAGDWGWPQLYIDNALCEVQGAQYRIAATGDFDPGAEGNSLHHQVNDQTALANFHLPNVWNESLLEVEGQIVTVAFDLWVILDGVSGGHVYIGGDHGGGGFDFSLDRGPQLFWQEDGMLAYTSWPGDAALPPIITPLVEYAVDEWQSIRVEIDLFNDSYDLYHGPRGSKLSLIGDDLVFRSPVQDLLDRFTVVHFGATETTERAYIDNIVVCVDDCPTEPPADCEGDANGDGVVDPLDSGFVLSRFDCPVGTGDPDCDISDQNGDGQVDPLDVGFVLSRFGIDCPAGATAPIRSETVFSAPIITVDNDSRAGI